MSQPSVGRIVHFYPTPEHQPNAAFKRQPFPAIVTHVWEGTSVNLFVFGDPNFGQPMNPTNVPQRVNGEGYGWEWPPYVPATK